MSWVFFSLKRLKSNRLRNTSKCISIFHWTNQRLGPLSGEGGSHKKKDVRAGPSFNDFCREADLVIDEVVV